MYCTSIVYQQVYNIPMGTTIKPTSGYGYGYIMAIPWPISTDTHTHDPRGYAVPMQMPNNHPGSQMGPADVLSCCDEVDTSLNNTTVTMLPTVSDVLICALDVELAEGIADSTATDLLVKDALDVIPPSFPAHLARTGHFWTVPCTSKAISTFQNQLARIWYTPCTASSGRTWQIFPHRSLGSTWLLVAQSDHLCLTICSWLRHLPG